MEYKYLTVGKRARAEQTIEKSRFIATVCPVDSRDDAEAFFAEIAGEFSDATHNVPAMIIGDKMQIQWASDNGEPQGTSGAPIVQMLVNKGITNIALVVTRYFGGIKLGTGGLVRAYTSSAELGLEASGVVAAVPFIECTVDVDYSVYNKIIKYRFPEEYKNKMQIGEAEFSEKVSFRLSAASELWDSVKNLLTEISGGSISFLGEEEILNSVPFENGALMVT